MTEDSSKENQKKRPRKKSDQASVRIVHPNAAGIDIGSQSHYVAVPADRDADPIRTFECFTADLHQLAEWLKQCRIETVVMESTGSYWMPVFEILESHGFEVCLVNARHVRNVPGRKTDVHDARWLQELHSYGLLSASFHPDDKTRVLRALVRQRDNATKSSTPHIQRMQKALTQMNIQLHEVISDITGTTGMQVIEAILAGERDPQNLLALKHARIKCTDETFVKSLEGNFRDELLFVLEQELDAYRFFRDQVEKCEAAIQSQLKNFDAATDDSIPPSTKPSKQRNPALREALFRTTGVDLTSIPALDSLTVQAVLAETGLDMSRWKTEKHFVSWATLSPSLRISGGRRLRSHKHGGASRVGQAFRMSAESLSRSRSSLGAFYRRLRARLHPSIAIGAAARKLATAYYRCLKDRRPYIDEGEEKYSERFKARSIASLKKRAATLGLQVIEATP